MEKAEPNRKKRARLRCACAALLALILLVSSGFAFLKLVRGSAYRADPTALAPGDYVTTNVDLILGYAAEGYGPSGVTKTLYAVVPYDGRLAVVVLPRRYFPSAETVRRETEAFLGGALQEIDSYILVTGTGQALSEAEAGLFYDWFGENKDRLRALGLVPEGEEDYAHILSDTALRADRVGRVSTAAALTLTGLAWLLLIYAAVVLLRLSLGRYEQKETAPEGEPKTEEEA